MPSGWWIAGRCLAASLCLHAALGDAEAQQLEPLPKAGRPWARGWAARTWKASPHSWPHEAQEVGAAVAVARCARQARAA